MLVLVHLVVSLGMLIVVPLGLTLLVKSDARWWLVPAVPGVVSLWLPRGPVAVALAGVYLVGTLVLAGLALRHLYRRAPSWKPLDLALATALGTPLVAGIALVAERASYRLFGFKLEILSLTVAHFHFAGFAAALIAFLVAGTAPSRVTTAAAISVPVGTGIVLLGFFLGDLVELIGAAVLTAGMWATGWALWQLGRGATRMVAVLLTTSAAVLVATMLLALSWALGHVIPTPYLSLEWMVATHGVANALGFALCGLLGWKGRDEARGAAGTAVQL